MAFVADGYTFVFHALDAPYTFLSDLQRVVEGAAQNAALLPGVAASVHGARYEQLLARLAWLDGQLCAIRADPSTPCPAPLLQPSFVSHSASRATNKEVLSSVSLPCPECSSAFAVAGCSTTPPASSHLRRGSKLRFRQDLRVLADMSHALRVRRAALSSALRSEETALLRWLDALCNSASRSTVSDERCQRLCAGQSGQRRSRRHFWLPWSSRRAAGDLVRETVATSSDACPEVSLSRSACESAQCEVYAERDQARQLLHTTLVGDFQTFLVRFKRHFVALCRQIVTTLQEWASQPPLPPRSRLLLSPPTSRPLAGPLCVPLSPTPPQPQSTRGDARSGRDVGDDLATSTITPASGTSTSATPESTLSGGAHWLLQMGSPTVPNPLHARPSHAFLGSPGVSRRPPPLQTSELACAPSQDETARVVAVSSPLVLSNSSSDVLNAPPSTSALAESGTRAASLVSITSSNVSSSLVSLMRSAPLSLPRNGDQDSTRRPSNAGSTSRGTSTTTTPVHEPLRYYAFDRLRQSTKSVVQAYCLSLDYFLHLYRRAQADFPADVVVDLRQERTRLTEAPVLRRYEASLDELLGHIFAYRKRLELLQWQHTQLRFAEAKLAHHTLAGRRRKVAEWQARLNACRAELETSAEEMLMRDVEQLFVLYDNLFDWAALYFSRLLDLLESDGEAHDAC